METNRLHQLKSELQGNILTPYRGAYCARAWLVRFVPGQSEARRREWLRQLAPLVRFGIERDHEGDQFVNLAFSHAGLQALGVDQTELSAFPAAFAQGMERRGRLLGDGSPNEASKWARGQSGANSAVHILILLHARPSAKLVQTLKGLGAATRAEAVAVGDRKAVHANGARTGVLQQVREELDRAELRALGSAAHSLSDPLVDVVSQDLHAPLDEQALPLEYFGFRDGIGQPQILNSEGESGAEYPLLGRFVIQHGAPLQVNGSFLVVRQLEQDTALFWKQLWARCPADLTAKELAEAVMGRRMDGRRLDGSEGETAFDRDGPEAQCPFHSHVRRMNPQLESTFEHNPRLIRRGISYADEKTQGLFFMAYNADLEQQFEFIQRNWVQRGNHVGLLSKHADPVTGLANGHGTNGSPSPNFWAALGDGEVALELGSAVRLVGGGYFFVPGRAALHRIADAAPDANTSRPAEHPVAAALGACQTDRDRHVLIQSWIDDLRTGGSFWRYVAGLPTGTCKVGKVLFVANPALVEEMLLDAKGEFSVQEYGRRMRATFGNFMLGMDKVAHDLEYRANRVIPSPNLYAGFHQPPQPARLQEVQATARLVAEAFVQAQEARALPGANPVINLRQLIATVLGRVAERYFGMSELSVGSMLIWSGYIARWQFRFATDTIDEMHCRAAGGQLMSHVLGLIAAAREQRHDGSLAGKPADHPAKILLGLLDTIQAGLEQPAGDEIARTLSGARTNDYDLARNLIGITLGSLAATAKAVLEGFSLFARAAIAQGGQVTWPVNLRPLAQGADPTADDSAFAQIIEGPLHKYSRGSLDSVYRTYRGQTAWRRGEIEIAPQDTVVVWLGGAPKTEALDPLFGAGIHKCPGMDMGKAVMNGAMMALVQLDVWPRLDAEDDLVLDFKRPRDAARGTSSLEVRD